MISKRKIRWVCSVIGGEGPGYTALAGYVVKGGAIEWLTIKNGFTCRQRAREFAKKAKESWQKHPAGSTYVGW